MANEFKVKNGIKFADNTIQSTAGLPLTGGTLSGTVESTGFIGRSYGASSGAPDGWIWSVSPANPTWGIYYNEGTPDAIEFRAADVVKASIFLDTGAATFLGTVTAPTFSGTLSGTATGLTDNTSWMLSRGSIAEASIDSATSNGFYTISRTGHSTSTLTWNAGGSSGPVQLDFHYGGTMQFRNKTDSTTWTAWKTVLTSANVSTYALPISGGTLTGAYLDFSNSSPSLRITSGPGTFFIGDDDIVNLGSGAVVATPSSRIASGVAILSTYAYATSQGDNRTHFGYYDGSGYVNYIRGAATYFDSGTLQVAGNQVLHAGNYSSYALPLTGGALTGSLSIQGSNYINLASATYSNVGVIVGNWSGAGWWGFGSESGHILKFDQVSGNTFQGASDITLKLGTKTVLDSGNYTNYSPSLTGSGANGTWGINITGSAGSAGNADTVDNLHSTSLNVAVARYNNGGASASGRLQVKLPFLANSGKMLKFTVSLYASYVQHTYEISGYLYSTNNNWYTPIAIYNGSGSPDIIFGREADGYAYVSIGSSAYVGASVHSVTIGYTGSAADAVNVGWTITDSSSAPNTVSATVIRELDSSNYSSYALPLSGGTLSGNLNLTSGYIDVGSHLYARANYNVLNSAANGWLTVIDRNGGSPSLGNVTYGGNTIIHAGNYSSYSTFSGAVTSSGNNGFRNDVYYSGARNPIWCFGNATTYGISYFQGTSGIGSTDTFGVSVNGSTSATGVNFAVTPANSYVNNNIVLHAGNYSSYSPSYSYFDDYTRGNYRVISDYTSTGTWYIRTSSARFIWARAHDWTQSFELGLTGGTGGSNDGWATFGQITSNVAAGTWKGTRFVQYTGSTMIDGYTRAGRYYLGDDTNYITSGGAGAIRSQTATGYIDMGSMNASWAHFQTDRPGIYFNKDVSVDGQIYKYGAGAYLHTGNYNSYAPSLTGSGASGTWGISITGSANSASSVALHSSNEINIGGGYTGNSRLYVNYNDGGSITEYGFYNGGTSLAGIAASYGSFSGTLGATGTITQNGNQVLHAGNYTSYSPSLTGSGASGTWGINITGNSNYASSSGSAGSANAIGSTGYGSTQLTWRQESGTFAGYSGWASYLISAHGDGATYYNQTLIMPFWSAPQYSRLEGGTFRGPYTFLTTENYNNYTYPLASRANRANGNFYIDDNYGCGIVGAYASTRYQGVFAMGDSYKLPADGTGLGTLYGIAWSHPNAGGAAGNLTDHGMLIINNGSFRCAISNSIVASANITAYSDERLKTNWRDMPENYVARLAQVKVGIYDRTDQENITQVGVSAQSFQKLLPESIVVAKDDMQTLSVNYGGAALASTVELAKDNVELRARIERLEALIEQLLNKE